MAWSFRNLFGRSPFDIAVQNSYIATVAQARQPEFYRDWEIPDSAIGRFDLIALHGFLILHRLKEETAARRFAAAYSEAIFDDMDRNLREMGVGDLSVGKKVRKLAEGFFGRAAAYEKALAADDENLCAVLRRNLYAEEGPESDTIKKLADYVRRCVTVLAEQDVSALTEGRVDFAPLKVESV